MSAERAATEVFWLEQADGDIPAENRWLGPGELLRLNSLRFPKRRNDWRLGRWTAKRAVAACLDMASAKLAEIEIRTAPSGAPEVYLSGDPAPVAISISHRAGMAACAVGPHGAELGCDLEIAEPRSDAFIADYFTEEERAAIAGAPVEERPLLIALFWSAKESALKALRTGLRLDTRWVAVTLGDASVQGWQPLVVRYTAGRTFHGWWRHSGGLVRTVVAAPLVSGTGYTTPELVLAARARGNSGTAIQFQKAELVAVPELQFSHLLTSLTG